MSAKDKGLLPEPVKKRIQTNNSESNWIGWPEVKTILSLLETWFRK
jgi:hypothetical protein